MYSGYHGRTIIFCETKKEAQELSQNVSIKQVGLPPFPLGRKHLSTNSPILHVRGYLIHQSYPTDEAVVAQTQGYMDRLGSVTLLWCSVPCVVGYSRFNDQGVEILRLVYVRSMFSLLHCFQQKGDQNKYVFMGLACDFKNT